jgi:hypothetical protein
MTRGQILIAFLSLLLIVTAATIGRQPEDEVPITPPPDRSTEIPTTTARSLFLDGMRYQLAQAHERAGDIAAAMRLYDDALLRQRRAVPFQLCRIRPRPRRRIPKTAKLRSCRPTFRKYTQARSGEASGPGRLMRCGYD